MTENDLSSVPNLQDTSEKVTEVLEDTIIESQPIEPEVDNVFEELGVSPFEVIKYIIIFILLFGGFIYGGFKVFKIFFPSNSTISVQPSTQPVKTADSQLNNQETPQVVIPETNIDEVVDNTAPSIKVISKSLPLVFEINESSSLNSKLENYLLSYKSMKNIYNTDLSSFLDASADRELAFFQYINEYEAALVNLKLSVNNLNSEISYFQDVVVQANIEVDTAEKTFFNKVQTLDNSDLNQSLMKFQTLSKRKIDLTSELKSRQAILSRIGKNIDAISIKLDAVKLNKDAYIKGVTITEVDGVDLNLIKE